MSRCRHASPPDLSLCADPKAAPHGPKKDQPMTDLVTTIKAQFLQARKDRDPNAGILSVVVSAIQAHAKDHPKEPMNDTIATAILRKTRDEVREARNTPGISDEFLAQCTSKEAVLDALMPAQMDPSAIDAFVRAEIVRAGLAGKPIGPATGALMKALKSAHGGSYDGAEAAAIVKTALTQAG